MEMWQFSGIVHFPPYSENAFIFFASWCIFRNTNSLNYHKTGKKKNEEISEKFKGREFDDITREVME